MVVGAVPGPSTWLFTTVCHEDILPHLMLPQQKEQHSGQHTSCRHEYTSFSDLSLVRDAVECHRRATEASMGALRAETAWLLLYTFEVRPGLRLSISSTMASPACHLSVPLKFWSTALECTFLKVLEDRHLTAQPVHPQGIDLQELVFPRHGYPNSLPQVLNFGGALGAAGGRGQRLPKVPQGPLHVPTPNMKLLHRFGMMCGQNQRVRITEAVPFVLRSIMRRYFKHLPLDVWGAVCMQIMHAIHQGVEPLVGKVAKLVSTSESQHALHVDGVEECQWGPYSWCRMRRSTSCSPPCMKNTSHAMHAVPT